ncbi:2,3-diketo-5-methylthio-1-phosphopentane phosphatase [bacterium SCN 62-11]|nr:acireductone synthase [Candidatus Eremiobacteraeota bacterium]ODT58970.1 MAG: 2,3-diketo-5-methylthio-1-phosphopentane phosphatase [bacterium SCN 62-11]
MKPVYLLDIEGTTTPISFVYEVLFPFARAQFGSFLRDHWENQDIRQEALALSEGIENFEQAEQAALSLMDQDRKLGALKSLQGRIWEDGYRSGQLKSQIFDEVANLLRTRKSAGLRTYIYSSGSVLAQKLLFAHTPEGDLTHLLDGYFDTSVGAKGEAESYRKIANQIGIAPGDGLFATDVVGEARAAREAGWEAAILLRPGNHPQPAHDFPEWTALD